MRALIVGGSVGGLFAAHLLRGIGWDVAVFERSAEDLAGRGAGIGTRPDLFRIMRRCGLSFDAAMGIAVPARLWLGRAGDILYEYPIAAVNGAWDWIYRPLRAALPEASYRAGTQFERIEENGGSVAVRFADGTRAEGDLLIGADGLHSTVRAELLSAAEPRYAGYVAWRGVVENPALPAPVAENFIFCFGPGELLIAMPMPARDGDLRPDKRRHNWVWFRPAEATRELPALCTDASGRRHGLAIPPHLIRPELIAEVKAAAAARLAPAAARLVAATARPLLQPIFDFAAPGLAFGRAVLLGDAACVARPHVGAGVTKAALDAEALADALAGAADLGAALADYQRRRLALGNALVARSRALGGFLETGGLPPDPPAIVRDYGAAVLDAVGI